MISLRYRQSQVASNLRQTLVLLLARMKEQITDKSFSLKLADVLAKSLSISTQVLLERVCETVD